MPGSAPPNPGTPAVQMVFPAGTDLSPSGQPQVSNTFTLVQGSTTQSRGIGFAEKVRT